MTQTMAGEDRVAILERELFRLRTQLSVAQYELELSEIAIFVLGMRLTHVECEVGNHTALDPLMERLNNGLLEARGRIESLRAATTESWDTVRSGLQDAIKELRGGIEEATSTTR